MRDRCPGEPHGALALDVRGLGVEHKGQPALEGVTFALEAGGFLGVVGPNGAGKTTLLRVLAGVMPPSMGEVRVFGQRPSVHLCIGYLPQRTQADLSFPLTVADVVALGRYGRRRPFQRLRAADRAKIHEALVKVGLEKLARRPMSELSGGEQQRMFIARALAQEARLLLLDEPLAGLDAPAQRGLLVLLRELCTGGLTAAVALHELGLAEEHFPHVLLLNRRMIAFGPPLAVFAPDNLRQAYGEGLRILGAALGESCCGKGEDG